MVKDSLCRALCFAGGVVTTVACTRYLTRRHKQAIANKLECERQERTRREIEIESLKTQLCSKVDTVSERFEILLDCCTSSHADAIHAVILGAQEIGNMTESLGGKIEEAKARWREILLNSYDTNIVFSGVAQAKQIGMDTQKFIETWKQWVLETTEADAIFDTLDRKEVAAIGIDEEPFKERWRALILKSRELAKVYTAIHRAVQIGVDEQSLKDHWKDLVLHRRSLWDREGDIQAVFSAISQAAEIGIDTQPLKKAWVSLFSDNVLHWERFADWIPRCAEIGVDDHFLKQNLKASVLECKDAKALVTGIPKVLQNCAAPTGRIVSAHVSPTVAGLVVSCQFLSGKTAFPEASFLSDATVASLENCVKQEMAWESTLSIDSLSNSSVPRHRPLVECSDLVIQELGIGDGGLRQLCTRLVLLDTSPNVRVSGLRALLTHRMELRSYDIDFTEIETLRDWVSAAISVQENVKDLNLLSDLVADVPSWASALATRLKVLEARAGALKTLSLKPSVGSWMLSFQGLGRGRRRRPPSGMEYQIILEKVAGTRLGVDVDNQDGTTLLIESITGGLIQNWNDREPNCAVQVGDRIVGVNGIRGDLVAIVDECKKTATLLFDIIAA